MEKIKKGQIWVSKKGRTHARSGVVIVERTTSNELQTSTIVGPIDCNEWSKDYFLDNFRKLLNY